MDRILQIEDTKVLEEDGKKIVRYVFNDDMVIRIDKKSRKILTDNVSDEYVAIINAYLLGKSEKTITDKRTIDEKIEDNDSAVMDEGIDDEDTQICIQKDSIYEDNNSQSDDRNDIKLTVNKDQKNGKKRTVHNLLYIMAFIAAAFVTLKFVPLRPSYDLKEIMDKCGYTKQEAYATYSTDFYGYYDEKENAIVLNAQWFHVFLSSKESAIQRSEARSKFLCPFESITLSENEEFINTFIDHYNDNKRIGYSKEYRAGDGSIFIVTYEAVDFENNTKIQNENYSLPSFGKLHVKEKRTIL